MLEFQPSRPLPAGQKYEATLNLAAIDPTGSRKKTFVFRFASIKQAIEITMDLLESIRISGQTRLQLSGVLTTSDAANSVAVQKVISAMQADRRLDIHWEHAADRKAHSFTILDVRHGDKSSPVQLHWDGTPIGADQKGRRAVSVPALDTFEAIFARAIQANQTCIEVQFTDPLKKNQNLNGLITVENHQNLRFDIINNKVRIYSSDQWQRELKVKISTGIRNINGRQLDKASTFDVFFKAMKPQVRFAGKGVILPTTQGVTIPIETINLTAVKVAAIRIPEENLTQYLQVNNLDGKNELRRVGRIVWQDTIQLNWSPDKHNRWVRTGLDVEPLIDSQPGSIYRLVLYFDRHNIVYNCAASADDGTWSDSPLELENLEEESDSSYWDGYQQSEGDWYQFYRNRDNPCHPAYYRKIDDHDIRVSRNILISDIGLTAKKGDGDKVWVAVTDLKSARPMAGVTLSLLDYQQDLIVEGRSDESGLAVLTAPRKPFLLVAQKNGISGYLKLDNGSALSVSHFDVAGARVEKGIKGFIYGERGVWRPGDPIHLTFILMDPDDRLPSDHPVRFELINPRGQRVRTETRTQSLNGFYSFPISTSPEDPTGNWLARVKVGGASFEKKLKVETIMPNRLKVNLDFGPGVEHLAEGDLKAAITSTWLHGAVAKNLKADLEISFTPRKTMFPAYEAYIFDDPVRKYETESETVFDGELDEHGKAKISTHIEAENLSPGMLTAQFTTRIYEPGGAFSVDHYGLPYHPYERYVGLKTPKGDKARGILLTDTDHTARLVMLDTDGQPVQSGEVEMEIHKIRWRWWWEKGEESLADYVGRSSFRAIKRDTIAIEDGKGEWTLQIKYPQWGRYLIRARDKNGSHITGKIVYIDWPGWAGRAQKDQPGGASVLTFAADKTEYHVGDTVSLTIPTSKGGRGLLSIETGSKVLKQEWIEGQSDSTRYTFETTAEMAPNIYAHVTFIQPHLQSANDLPLRMYGVIPIKVINSETRLEPEIVAPAEFEPESQASINIKETNGRPMTYTVAIVDEGLLDLTRFATPDPWHQFYRREALGIRTWDMFDDVAGAFGGALEQLLAIGGDAEAEAPPVEKKVKRFPPMVKCMGPFELAPGAENNHTFEIPQYIGSVRVMVVAGHQLAFGATETSVFVRKPLMLLGTLPRVLGPEETLELPVSVFVLDDAVKSVSVKAVAQGPMTIEGSSQQNLVFEDIGDQLVHFPIQVDNQLGIAAVELSAEGNGHNAAHRIELDVRSPIQEAVDVLAGSVEPGETWLQSVEYPGIAGSNTVVLEVSRVPPLNLSHRLGFLIRYPHGCVEQTTSAVFPQLFLNQLVQLSAEKQDAVQHNIQAGIERLQQFQTSVGGFGYWPGAPDADAWSTSYAGHFLTEAQKAGYLVPPDMLILWKNHQRSRAQAWVTGSNRSELIQAYRLYTLALAGEPELGAMNRLREQPDLPDPARWRLAAAYHLAGQPEAAEALVNGANLAIEPYRELSNTYGSELRDKAMILETLVLMGHSASAQTVMEEIASALAADQWLSTQSTAYALIALARAVGIADQKQTTAFKYTWNDNSSHKVSSTFPVVQQALNTAAKERGTLQITNTSERLLYTRIIVSGMPAAGTETAAANRMSLKVGYFDLEGNRLDPVRLEQGTDLVVEVTVQNTGRAGTYEEVALTHIVPSGWEIHNPRLFTENGHEPSQIDYQDIRDDRIYSYFDIDQGESKTFKVLCNASYIGKFYLPMISVEAMYHGAINARLPGRWIEVVPPGAATEPVHEASPE